MERDWLEAQLEAGRSIESIAREVVKHPSTVAYWVKKFGLRSEHAERHRPLGGIGRDELADLVGRGFSSRQIAAELGRSQATVNHWLRRHGLRTERARSDGPQPAEVLRTCARHGEAVYVRYGETD